MKIQYVIVMLVCSVVLSSVTTIGVIKYLEHQKEEQQKEEMRRFFGVPKNK